MAFKEKTLFGVTTSLFSILVISLFFSPSLRVTGHSIPDKYTLSPNSLIEKPESFPSSISILFSERPDSKVSYIHVLNSEGKQIDNDDFKITGEFDREGTVTIDNALIRQGVYSVSWSTLSLDDGHVSRGTYVVGVEIGKALSTNGYVKNANEINTVFSPVLGLVKIPIIVGQVYLLGFVFSQIFIWRDIRVQELKKVIDFISLRRFMTPIVILSFIMGISATLIPLIQSIIISNTQSEYVRNLSLLYFDTTNGQIWLIRIIFCAIIGFAAYYYGRGLQDKVNGADSAKSRIKGPIMLYIVLIAITSFIATNSITSHSSSVTWPYFGIPTDFVHSVAVSIWIGGLVYISFVLFPNLGSISNNISGKTNENIAQPKSILLLVLSKFSVISSICVGAVGITGLFLAWLHIQSMDELLLSDYGRTLIIKLCLALPVIIMGGYHQFWISKMMKILDLERVNADESRTLKFDDKFSSLKKTVKIECILASCVLCAASFLTVTSPPMTTPNNEIIKSSDENISHSTHSQLIRTLEAQGIPIRLVIYPFVSGFNSFTINVLDNTENIGQISNVSMEFKKTDASIGPIFAKLVSKNDTAYSTYGGYLSQPGDWDAKLTIKRSNLYDLVYRDRFTLNNTMTTVANDQHQFGKVKLTSNAAEQSSFTPVVIILSVIIAALSIYFCINAFQRMQKTRQRLGVKN